MAYVVKPDVDNRGFGLGQFRTNRFFLNLFLNVLRSEAGLQLMLASWFVSFS